jgi:hypothetical protein
VTGQLRSLSLWPLATGLLFAACRKASDRATSAATANASSATAQAADSKDDRYRAELTCTPGPETLCLRDTAIIRSDANHNDIYATADWILFAAGGDSVEVSTIPPGAVATNLGQERDSLHNTAAYFRHRFTGDGVLQVWVSLDESSDTVPYTLRLRHVGSQPAALAATAQSATIRLVAPRQTDRFSVVPASRARRVKDLSPWTVPLGVHKVALVADSLYEVCRVPCSAAETVRLTPSTVVTKRF